MNRFLPLIVLIFVIIGCYSWWSFHQHTPPELVGHWIKKGTNNKSNYDVLVLEATGVTYNIDLNLNQKILNNRITSRRNVSRWYVSRNQLFIGDIASHYKLSNEGQTLVLIDFPNTVFDKMPNVSK